MAKRIRPHSTTFTFSITPLCDREKKENRRGEEKYGGMPLMFLYLSPSHHSILSLSSSLTTTSTQQGKLTTEAPSILWLHENSIGMKLVEARFSCWDAADQHIKVINMQMHKVLKWGNYFPSLCWLLLSFKVLTYIYISLPKWWLSV